MKIRLIIPFASACIALASGPASAEEVATPEEDVSTQFLGPFEFAPFTVMGNLGAPRATSPETRLGVALQWRTDSMDILGVSTRDNILGLLIEAHLELFGFLEVGVDFEVFDHHDSDATGMPTSDDFGFVVPRAKVLVLPLDWLDIAVGVGILLPTTTYESYESVHPLAFDPGVYIAYRPLTWLSINATIPIVFWLQFPDSGTDDFYYFSPTLGATVMPLDFIGGFVDLQFHVWMNPPDLPAPASSPDPLQALNLMIGGRSRPLEWLLLEAGVIVPLAGQRLENADIGIGVRISATPDFL
ncbi:MAG: hypothetical protein HY907_09880 [Deltaproteobacteria bacterium]|nr:hypothetical protein [Deltaproteobacteria bacterium]